MKEEEKEEKEKSKVYTEEEETVDDCCELCNSRQPRGNSNIVDWLSCASTKCNKWFHSACLPQKIRNVDPSRSKFKCDDCKYKERTQLAKEESKRDEFLIVCLRNLSSFFNISSNGHKSFCPSVMVNSM